MLKSETIRIRLNTDLHGYKAGQELDIKVDENKIPIDRLWRRRLKDSKTDNCVEIIVNKITASKDSK